MGEIITSIVFIVLILSCFSLKTLERHFERKRIHEGIDELQAKQETKESLDAFTHVHTKHWEYIQSILPWRPRLLLSRFRGKKWALKILIKPLCLVRGIDPEGAQWILEEYMITTKVEDLPPPENTWVCPHCGTANTDTALFCKDCGEYK